MEEFITNITNVLPETVHTTKLYGTATFKVSLSFGLLSLLGLPAFLPAISQHRRAIALRSSAKHGKQPGDRQTGRQAFEEEFVGRPSGDYRDMLQKQMEEKNGVSAPPGLGW